MACPLRTLYIGGGTPSLMPPVEFKKLVTTLKPYLQYVEEFTIEVNPDDVNEENLELWKSGGVNRLSMGIQSFDDDVLKALGRRHDAMVARQAYQLARRYFDNISIDLMFGLPGQTVEMWTMDIGKAIALRPEHISAYSLMYEEGTALTVMRDNGRLEEASDDTSEKMFLILIDELKKAGYDHYETSNYAFPGYRSLHNSSYWIQLPYLGLGPSAHSYDGMRTRRANKADLRGYIEYWTKNPPKNIKGHQFYSSETLSDEELLEEYVMTRMRTREGIPIEDLRCRFGDSVADSLLKICKGMTEKGLLISDEKSISLHESAILISDTIILEMLNF